MTERTQVGETGFYYNQRVTWKGRPCDVGIVRGFAERSDWLSVQFGADIISTAVPPEYLEKITE